MRTTVRLAMLAFLLSASAPALAQKASGRYSFDLPSEDLSTALRAVADVAGLDLVAPGEVVKGRASPALKAILTPEEALAVLLKGSGLGFTKNGRIVLIERVGDANPSAEPGSVAASNGAAIEVTGTRIRGAAVASPVIRLSREEIRNRGQGSLADAVRAVPQNFGGGQNPGIGNNVPATSGVNVGGATSVNLRGLGSDATLTLVDGHRLSYSASRQAIDISSIPLEAVDRIEIVPDGASALYGSDAVAGVVNVILRRDFSGIETSARLGGATDGGDFEQRYGLTAGATWRSGGVVAVYEFARTTAIWGRDRSYSETQAPALTLFPSMRNHSATLSAYQKIGEGWSLEFDGLFNQRYSASSYALNAAGNIAQSGAALAYNSRSFALAPTLKFRPGGDWTLFATGSFAEDHTHYDVKSFFNGTVFDFPGNCYCNRAGAFELGGDGTLFRGPGGPIKLAAGAGWRTNSLVRFNGPGASTNVAKTQASYYAYGEISLPLIASDEHMPLVERLSVSAAARYERYPRIGEVVTPKLGAIYAPSADVTLKASWGKSFRAPTLYQQYQALNAVVARPSAFGGSNYPAGTTGLLVQGGNPGLKPERARSWSATISLHPRALEGLSFEASYFNTRYRDRVVTPIVFLSQALSDPINAGRLTFNPSAALISQTIAGATSFANVSGAPFDPANVRVLVDDRNVNAGLQKIHGLDFEFSYERALGAGLGDLEAHASATLLNSAQQLTPAQPVVPLAGILFSPPHFSGRGDLAWRKGGLTLDVGVTRIGGVEDKRAAPEIAVGGMTTFDLTARLKPIGADGLFKNLDASVSVQNLFNAKPARIATSLPSDAPYDSTNYSPVGRFVAVTVSKTW